MTDQRIAFVDAVRLVGDLVPAGPTEMITTESAQGRITASVVIAKRDCPPFDMAAMDGFAIATTDLQGPVERKLHVGKP